MSVSAPGTPVYRLTKIGADPFEPAPWDLVGGNRFDDPDASQFRTIYCSTERAAVFGETLARYRRSMPLIALMHAVEDADESIEEALFGLLDPSDERRGVIPVDWRFKRQIGMAKLDPSLLFADIVAAESISHLREALAPIAIKYKLDEFSISTVLSDHRPITQHCASYIYNQLDDEGKPRFAGIRYPSKHNGDWICWAVFEDRMGLDPSFRDFHDTSIDPKDPHLLEVLDLMDLSLETVRGSDIFLTGPKQQG